MLKNSFVLSLDDDSKFVSTVPHNNQNIFGPWSLSLSDPSARLGVGLSDPGATLGILSVSNVSSFANTFGINEVTSITSSGSLPDSGIWGANIRCHLLGSGNNFGIINGVDANASYEGTGTVQRIRAVHAAAANMSTGTVATELIGCLAQVFNPNGGSVPQAYALYVDGGITVNAFGEYYGIYVTDHHLNAPEAYGLVFANGTNAIKLDNNADGPTISSGANVPEGTFVAPVGSIYLKTNGGVGTTFYVKESGTGNTGWVAK